MAKQLQKKICSCREVGIWRDLTNTSALHVFSDGKRLSPEEQFSTMSLMTGERRPDTRDIGTTIRFVEENDIEYRGKTFHRSPYRPGREPREPDVTFEQRFTFEAKDQVAVVSQGKLRKLDDRVRRVLAWMELGQETKLTGFQELTGVDFFDREGFVTAEGMAHHAEIITKDIYKAVRNLSKHPYLSTALIVIEAELKMQTPDGEGLVALFESGILESGKLSSIVPRLSERMKIMLSEIEDVKFLRDHIVDSGRLELPKGIKGVKITRIARGLAMVEFTGDSLVTLDMVRGKEE